MVYVGKVSKVKFNMFVFIPYQISCIIDNDNDNDNDNDTGHIHIRQLDIITYYEHTIL